MMCAHPSNKDVAEAIVGHFSVPSSSKVGRDESRSSVFFFVFLVQTVLRVFSLPKCDSEFLSLCYCNSLSACEKSFLTGTLNRNILT